jgi:hypothetical protein
VSITPNHGRGPVQIVAGHTCQTCHWRRALCVDGHGKISQEQSIRQKQHQRMKTGHSPKKTLSLFLLDITIVSIQDTFTRTYSIFLYHSNLFNSVGIENTIG